jgi:hypothetical protein
MHLSGLGVAMATPEALRIWAAQNRAWADSIVRDPETAASMRRLADEMDALAYALEHRASPCSRRRDHVD